MSGLFYAHRKHRMDEQKNPVLKAFVAWGGVGFSKYLEAIGIHSWGDVAAFLASLYSLFLIIDWIWKKWSNRHEK